MRYHYKASPRAKGTRQGRQKKNRDESDNTWEISRTRGYTLGDLLAIETISIGDCKLRRRGQEFLRVPSPSLTLGTKSLKGCITYRCQRAWPTFAHHAACIWPWKLMPIMGTDHVSFNTRRQHSHYRSHPGSD